MVRLTHVLVFSLTLAAALMLASFADAAAVTQQVYVTFDGSLSGTTYTLGAGEIDNTAGTFGSNGSATVSGGVGDVPGDTDKTSGFYFHGPSLGVGNLQTQNWVTEAIVSLDVPVAQQPSGDASGDKYNHFLDLQGDTFFRFNGDGNNPKITQFGYWDGGSEPIVNTPNLPSGQFVHTALTWDATTNTLEAFVGGVSQGTASSGSPFEVSSANIGYGFFSRFLNRAIDGKLDAVAFSTYTGTFDPSSDFQLPTVPEPSSLVLLVMAVALLPRFAKK